jgi:hypothetical protein
MQAYQKRKEEHMNSEVDNHYIWCDRCNDMVAGSHNCPSRGGEEKESILKDVFWIIIKTLIALFVLIAVFSILFFPFYFFRFILYKLTP